MNFDFNKTLSRQSTEDLVAMLQHPDKYHSDALTAARHILAQRRVSEDERQLILNGMEQEKEEQKARKAARKEHAIRHQHTMMSYLRTVVSPHSSPANKKIAFLYLLVMLHIFRGMAILSNYIYLKFIRKDDFLLTFPWLYTGFAVLCVIVLYLFNERSRWGWIFLYILCLTDALTAAILIPILMFSGHNPYAGSIAFGLIPSLALNTGCLILLSAPAVRAWLHISRKLWINLSIGLIVMVSVIILFQII